MRPTQRARLIVSAAIATIAAVFPIAEHIRVPTRPTDFGISWFGARSLLHGIDPYPLVGAGPRLSMGLGPAESRDVEARGPSEIFIDAIR